MNEWTKHSRKKPTRRIAIPVSDNLEKAIDAFQAFYPEQHFSDTRVLVTMIEAGFRQWVKDNN